MTPQEKDAWETIRAKGKTRYILLNGVIFTGGIYALAMTLVGYFVEYGFTLSEFSHYFFDTQTHIRFFLFATAFGLVMGFIKWHRGEKAFAEALAKEPAETV